MSDMDNPSEEIVAIRKALKKHSDVLELLMEGESESAMAREKLSGRMMFLFVLLALFLFFFGVYNYQKVATMEEDFGELRAQVTELESSMNDLTVLVRGHTHPPHDWLHYHYR